MGITLGSTIYTCSNCWEEANVFHLESKCIIRDHIYIISGIIQSLCKVFENAKIQVDAQ